MGNTSSMLTQYDIEEVQNHCHDLFEQQEILSLYQRFCQLDRNAKGFISADEFLSVPEFAMNPLSQRLLKMVDGLNFKDFVAFLSAFCAKASLRQKVQLIFKVYDSDCNGKVSFKDIMEVLRDLSGSFMSDQQREQVLSQVLKESGYTSDSFLTLEDFIKIENSSTKEKHKLIPLLSFLHYVTPLQVYVRKKSKKDVALKAKESLKDKGTDIVPSVAEMAELAKTNKEAAVNRECLSKVGEVAHQDKMKGAVICPALPAI